MARTAVAVVLAALMVGMLAETGGGAPAAGTTTIACPRLASSFYLNFRKHTGPTWDSLPFPFKPKGDYYAAVQTRGGGVSRPHGIATYGFASEATRYTDRLCSSATVPKQRKAPRLSGKWFYKKTADGRDYWQNARGEYEYRGRYNCVAPGRLVIRVGTIRTSGRTVGSTFKAWIQPTGELVARAELRRPSSGASWFRHALKCDSADR